MKEITINIQEPYLSYILSGKKTVEVRLLKEKFKNLKAGDFLVVANRKIPIIGINQYSSFREMFQSEGVAQVIPDKNTIEDAESVCYQFYTKEMEKEYGVIAIKLASTESLSLL